MPSDNDKLRDEGDAILRANLPTDSELAMTGLHEIYQNLLAGGFTRLEALWISGYVLSGGSRLGEETGQ